VNNREEKTKAEILTLSKFKQVIFMSCRKYVLSLLQEESV